MKFGRNPNKGFVRLEALGGGRCRYVAGWRNGVAVVNGVEFSEEAEPGEKLKLLRGICRRLKRIAKPTQEEYVP